MTRVPPIKNRESASPALAIVLQSRPFVRLWNSFKYSVLRPQNWPWLKHYYYSTNTGVKEKHFSLQKVLKHRPNSQDTWACFSFRTWIRNSMQIHIPEKFCPPSIYIGYTKQRPFTGIYRIVDAENITYTAKFVGELILGNITYLFGDLPLIQLNSEYAISVSWARPNRITHLALGGSNFLHNEQ